jgi:hypothetical protein
VAAVPQGAVAADVRDMRPIALYARIGRTYAAWAPSLLLLALIVFVPLGLLHALATGADIGSLDFDGGLEVAAVAALLVLAATGLVGEVFYAGAVAISLTHPHGGKPPPLREIARMVNYRTLIVVDLIYAILVAVGFVAFLVPGIVAFVYLGLAAPVVEIERRGVREALVRSASLVRGSFWVVLAVLVPIELLGDGVTSLATALAHDLLGESLLSEWLADVLANLAFTPFYAVAVVLIAVTLIGEKDEERPELHSAPASR